MLLGFKRRFAPWVEEGSKTHTIRARRMRRPKPGQVCHCYVDPRQKTMRLLGRWPCVKVEEIIITADNRVILDGEELTPDERNAFAWRDGFRDCGKAGAWELMARFWRATHPKRPFVGDVIHWDYSKPVVRFHACGRSRRTQATRAALADLARVTSRNDRAILHPADIQRVMA